MLLRHTTADIKERKALTVNPAKTCQPIGAMYAALGIHGCLPHSHGSQGCYAYHRSTLTRHYKEPVMAATSAFTEGASVFGGQANLLQAIDNIFTVYEPEVIAVHTTCLSETIGDDIPQIVNKAKADGRIPEGKYVFHANTPSYVGSHVTGFASMTKAMVDYFAESGPRSRTINLIPGFVEPADMTEIRRLATEMGISAILFPDTARVLNGPLTGKYRMFPEGGVTIDQLRQSGASVGSIALGALASAPAGLAMDAKCKVPCAVLNLPIGLHDTDLFVDTLRRMAGVNVPETIDLERGQLVDAISDWHPYLYGKRVGLVGDPDQLLALSRFLTALDMRPVYLVTGSPAGKKFEEQLRETLADAGDDLRIAVPGDMFLFHQWIKERSVDLLMGNTYLKYIARDEDIPFVRCGFPILDRMGHSYFPTVGYRGALRLLEKMLDAVLDRKERDSSDIEFELVL
ncbi:nitrogenase component 1 [Desulfatitalea alkaliphila]|uniref:Nitrogenase molybdenum-iron protein subunit beta n=1 Tax=Desulfatitalea alkaliphila TaxID=2929485 RepID=A0AA41UJ31_9BACT|nr:nitrogenase component 1 [Desulfatitalea alkaliphila]MCJ8498946.1 nitrogenase molybdenum-iron protein subunit beta [Desulfatitalea alkaliphila]